MTEDQEPDFVIGYVDGEATITNYPHQPEFTHDDKLVDQLIARFKELGIFEPEEINEDNLEV